MYHCWFKLRPVFSNLMYSIGLHSVSVITNDSSLLSVHSWEGMHSDLKKGQNKYKSKTDLWWTLRFFILIKLQRTSKWDMHICKVLYLPRKTAHAYIQCRIHNFKAFIIFFIYKGIKLLKLKLTHAKQLDDELWLLHIFWQHLLHLWQ